MEKIAVKPAEIPQRSIYLAFVFHPDQLVDYHGINGRQIMDIVYLKSSTDYDFGSGQNPFVNNFLIHVRDKLWGIAVDLLSVIGNKQHYKIIPDEFVWKVMYVIKKKPVMFFDSQIAILVYGHPFKIFLKNVLHGQVSSVSAGSNVVLLKVCFSESPNSPTLVTFLNQFIFKKNQVKEK